MENLKRVDYLSYIFRTRKEIAEDYNVHPCTLKEMCRRIGITHQRRLSPGEQQELQKHYGMAGKFAYATNI